MKNIGCRFGKIVSIAICFTKTTDMNGSSYAEIPLRSSAILKIEKVDDKYCFFCSIKA